METVEAFIEENGIKPVFDALDRFRNGEEEFTTFATENDIDMDDWFEFGWMINETFSTGISGVIPLVDYNYHNIEEETKKYVNENTPLRWSDLIENVAANVESASVQDVNTWLETATIETDENDRVIDIQL